MDGHEYIKIYDNVLPDDLTEQLKLLEQKGNVVEIGNYGHVDGLMFESLQKAIHAYIAEFNYLTANHTINLNDDGYRLVDSDLMTDSMYCGANSVEHSNRVVTVIMFHEENGCIDFPIHGIKVSGMTGRVVMFPAHWTHPYKISEGAFFTETNLIY